MTVTTWRPERIPNGTSALTMLCWTGGHAPPRAQPYFLTNKTAPPSPHLPGADNPTNHQASRLPAISPPRHWLLPRFLESSLPACRLAPPLACLPERANGNPGHSGKGWGTFQQEAAAAAAEGEGCWFMLHILWISAHGGERETVQAHPQLLVNTPLLTATILFLAGLNTHIHTYSCTPHRLIYPLKYIEGLCIKESPYSVPWFIRFQPPKCRRMA